MKKALVVRGGWDGHEPVQTTDRFAAFLKEQGYDVRVEDNMDVYTDKAYMDTVDLVVPCFTMAEITGEQKSGLMDAVAAGTGIAGWHGGMCDAFRLDTDYQTMTGGQWVSHPGGCINYTVNITDKNDPIMAGIEDFEMVETEQYYMHVDPINQVLATTTFTGEYDDNNSKGAVMPVVWKKMWSKGKVFYSSLGHVNGDFDNDSARIIMERGLIWATR